MYLSTVFNQLLYGELSQTALTKNGTIAVADYARIVSYVNLGILELHKRFLLRERETIIQLYEHISNYHLLWDYAYTNTDSTQTYKYIIDSSAYPFNGYRIIKILAMYDEVGNDIVLNPSYTELELENENFLIAYTPSQLEIQIPYPDPEIAVSVICQVAPNDISTPTSALALASATIDLPEVLLNALLAFVADRYFLTMSADKTENKIYPNRFNAACAEIEANNLINTSQVIGQNRFWRNGWV